MVQTEEHPAELASRALPGQGVRRAALSIRLSAAIVTATIEEPRVLTVRIGHDPMEALPSGPLEVEHRTLEVGLRAWVERQTSQKLGYVEQLYTFGDRDRVEDGQAGRALTVAYLALVREARPEGAAEAAWQSWYRYFPWEDWRAGKPAALAPLEARLSLWAGQAGNAAERRLREERQELAFGRSWNEELVLERYELLYEAGLVQEHGAISDARRRSTTARSSACRWPPIIAASSPPRSAGCAARSNTGRSSSS